MEAESEVGIGGTEEGLVNVHKRQLGKNLRTVSPETLTCHDRLCLPENARHSLCL